MGAPISDFQKVISQTDQLASTTSGGNTSSAPTTTNTSSSSNHATSSTANVNTNQTSQVKNHHQQQHHHYNHQQRNYYPNIAGQHNQSASYHHQQQTIRFPPPQQQQQHHHHHHHHQQQQQQLGLPQLVYAAPTPNTALAYDHLQSHHQSHSSVAAAPGSFYSNNSWQPFAAGPSSHSLIAHALHHPATNHAAAALYPAAAASYYLPFSPAQPILYTTPTTSHQPAAQATNTAHLQSQYPTLLAAPPQPPVTCNDGSHHYHPQHTLQYSSTNVSLQSEQSESTSPAPTSASPASSSSSSSNATTTTTTTTSESAPDDTTATPDDGDGDDDDDNGNEDEPVVKGVARHPSKTASYDSEGAINSGNTGAAWMSAAGHPSHYQPATYYLTSATSASLAGFLLMSAYPLIPQANYTTEYMIPHPQLQQYSPLNATGYSHHGHFYTHPMLAPSGAHHHHLPATAYMQPSAATAALGQLKAGYNLISMLPIDAQPTLTRQAYGMDKVWQDEFECLFSSFLSNDVAWTLVEVETNPSIRDSSNRIIAYSGRYIIRASSADDATVPTSGSGEICCAGCEVPNVPSTSTDEQEQQNENSIDCNQILTAEGEVQTTTTDGSDDDVVSGSTTTSEHSDEVDLKSDSIGSSDAANETGADELRADEQPPPPEEQTVDDEATDDSSGSATTATDRTMQEHGETVVAAEIESDCDSGAQVNSTGASSSSSSSGSSSSSSSRSSSSGSGNHNDELVTSAATGTNSETNSKKSLSSQQQQQPDTRDLAAAKHESHPYVGGARGGAPTQRREFVKRFRMFIDSAKVRFCCDVCGHGWTSMKGRVVFWYELFEVVERQQQPGKMIGYCAYKLFGQQCDVCKIENRFERPMWYPEEVTKVLNNLYNKIGQVYFGFKMPAIDKQRRAGKPKTSHNSSLCQACHDGVCTDRK